MTTHKDACLDDSRELWDTLICLDPVSKDVRGDLRLLDRDLQTCDDKFRTLKTDHTLKVEVIAHEPCDSRAWRLENLGS